MFGISGSHLLILLIVLLIFGPRRLPELGSTLGKAMRNFKDGLSGVQDASFKHLNEGGPRPPVGHDSDHAHRTASTEPSAVQPTATDQDPAKKS